MSFVSLLLYLELYLSYAFANITVYTAPGQLVLGATASSTADAANYTGAAAYNPTRLNPPPLPSPLPAMQFPIQLQATGTGGLSISQEPGFMGFSVEMSVANQVFGKNSSLIQVPFLNLMATLVQRSGRVNIRVGGNSQERAVMVDSLPDGRVLSKGNITLGTTGTPDLEYTKDLLYMMRNISDMVNVHWFLGVPFDDPNNFRLQIVEQGQAILGEYLIALQVGNEPDLYPNRLRAGTYNAGDYFNEFGAFINAIKADSNVKNTSMLMGPSISGNGEFGEKDVWNTGFVDTYSQELAYLCVERYPNNNCAAVFHTGAAIINPQDVFADYLRHDAGRNLFAPFVDTPGFAQSKNKRYLMMETNTASCGGFAGISDSYAAALWGIDYALTLAYWNFSAGNFHIGGQAAFYNPFTPPPTNQSSFHQWTVGPIYYASMVMAEVMGTTTSQVLDLNANNASLYTPAYAIYENGAPVRVALFNYITDPSGGSTYTAALSVSGMNLNQVKIKRLTATSVADKYNYTWAGQTMGGIFEADGLLHGTENVETLACTGGTCNIQVPAPGFALVFLTDSATETAANAPVSFTTSVFTKVHNTATVDPSVLATSNGHSGGNREANSGSTSRGSVSGAVHTQKIWSVYGTISVVILTILLRCRFSMS